MTPEAAIHYYKHIGLYGYTRTALALFHSLPQSPLELAEKLEQLRYLENGVAIHVAETMFDTVGVDTAADLEQAAALLAAELTLPGRFRSQMSGIGPLEPETWNLEPGIRRL